MVVTADFQVTYLGTWSPAAQAAFQAAVDIWETMVVSSTPIRVTASWTDLGTSILGSAGPFICPGPVDGAWYGTALHASKYGTDCNGSSTDIDAEFNSAWSGWYLGTDGNPGASQIDFMSVVMHELGHGLAFIDSFAFSTPFCTAGTYCWGLGTSFPVRFDQFVVNGANEVLYTDPDYPNNSAALGTQLTSNNLFWSGSQGMAANGGTKPKLYAPNPYQPGSSVAHLDDATYNGTPNALMTHAISNDESIHDPGPVTLGILRDMGWSTASGSAEWTQLPGSAVDISVGASDAAWIIGVGGGIYQWTGSAWSAVAGAASRISVGPDGQPWVVNSAGGIFRRSGSTWTHLPGGALDIGVGGSGSGTAWVIGTNSGIFRWNGSGWNQMPGAAVRIAVDGSGNAWVVNAARNIYRWTGSTWQQVPGAAYDVGSGGDGSIWVIGTNVTSGGNGIYHWTGTTWEATPGGAIAVTAGTDGKQWIINSSNAILRKN